MHDIKFLLRHRCLQHYINHTSCELHVMRFVWTLLLFVVAAAACEVHGADLDGDGIDDAREQFVAEFFVPHIYFHPEETYYPTSADAFVNQSTLIYNGAFNGEMCVLESKGFFTTSELPSLLPESTPMPWNLCNQERDNQDVPLQVHPHPLQLKFGKTSKSKKAMLRGGGSGSGSSSRSSSSGMQLCPENALTCFETTDPETCDVKVECVDTNFQYVFSEYNDSTYDGSKGFSLELGGPTVERLFTGRVKDAADLEFIPVYVHVSPTPLAHPRYAPDTFIVQYWLLYPFSGEAESTFHGGQHEGDWEHLSLVVSNKTLAIHAAYFAAHSHESSWLTAPDYEVHDGHVRLFASRNTHASYPTVGRKSRAGGLVHDECSSEGIMWEPSVIINMGEKDKPMPNARWLRYNGFWGSSRLTYTGNLPFPTGFPPRTPSWQDDYWTLN